MVDRRPQQPAAMATYDVRAALRAGVHADVRYVQSTVDRKNHRVRVEVGIRSWHDEKTVMEILESTPDLENVTSDGVGVITGFRKLD